MDVLPRLGARRSLWTGPDLPQGDPPAARPEADQRRRLQRPARGNRLFVDGATKPMGAIGRQQQSVELVVDVVK